MALSIYDQRYLTTQQQDQIRNLTSMWEQAKSEEQRQSINVTANAIRAAAGYTGGTSGADFQVIDQSLFDRNQAVEPVVDRGREAPFIDPDAFSMQSLIQPIYELATQAPPTFDEIMGSEYYKSLEESIMARAGKTAQTVEQRIVDQMVSRGVLSSSMTAKDVSDAVANVFASAESDLLSMLPELQKNQMDLRQDQIKNLLTVSELAMTEFEYRLQMTDRQIEEAMERTKLRGYVDNEDAIILGVEPNTPSEDARKRQEELQDYINKQQAQLEFAKKEIDYRRESDLAEYREKAEIDGKGSGDDGNVTEKDYKDFNRYSSDYDDVVKSDRYELMTPAGKAEEVNRQLGLYEDLFTSDAMSEYTYKQLLTYIQSSSAYKEDFVGFVENEEQIESFKGLYPGSVLDR